MNSVDDVHEDHRRPARHVPAMTAVDAKAAQPVLRAAPVEALRALDAKRREA